MHIVRRMPYDIHRSTLTLGDTGDALYGVLLHQQTHALLTLVADDLLG